MFICFFINSDTILLSWLVAVVVVRSVDRCERVVEAEVKVGPLMRGYSPPTPVPVEVEP